MFKHLKLLKLLAVTAPAIVAIQPANYAMFSKMSQNLAASSIQIGNSTQNDYVSELTNINSANDYNPIYWDARTPVVSTELGTIGIDTAKKTIILTAYNGGVYWVNNLTNNTFVKKHYGDTDISSYTVKSWQKVYGKEQLLVLFSSASNTSGVLVLLDTQTGQVVTNSTNDAFICTVDDGVNTLYSTSDVNKYFVVNTDNSKSPVSLAKVTQAIMNDHLIYSKTIQHLWNDDNWDTRIPQFPNYDYFLGWIPGKINSGVNFAFFYSTKDTKNIYIAAINDDFKRVTDKGYGNDGWAKVNDETTSLEINFTDSTKWETYNKQFLYFGDRNKYSYAKNTDPNIYLIFNYTNTAGTTKIMLTKITDFTTPTNTDGSYKDKINTTSSSGTKTPNTIQLGTTVNELSSISSSNSVVYYTTKKVSNKEIAVFVAPNDAATNSIKKKTIGTFDGAANNHKKIYVAPIANYASQIGESITGANEIGFVFSNPNLTSNSVGVYTGTMPIGTENYTQQSYTPEFHKFNNVNNELKNSTLKNTKLASKVTGDDIKPYLKFKYANQTDYQTPKENYTITPQVSNANDNTGSLSYSYNVTFTTPWNQKRDTITYPSSFTISGDLTSIFYQLSNFNFKFVTSAADDKTKWEKIQQLKKSKKATEVTTQEILDNFIIQNNILDKDGNAFTITESMIEKTSNTNVTTLEIKINLPADKFPTLDESLLIQKYENFNQGSVNFNQEILTQYSNITVANNTATIDVATTSYENINNTIRVNDFISELDSTYKPSILKLFSVYGYDFGTIVNTSATDAAKTGIVNLKITFNKQADVIATDSTLIFNITIKGFKSNVNDASLTLNQDVINQSNITITDKTINIDVSKLSFGNIDNSLTIEDFNDGLTTKYIPTLSMMFKSVGYNTPVYSPLTNTSDSSVQLTITFYKSQNFEGEAKVEYTINISGFYVIPTTNATLSVNQTYIDSNNAVKYDSNFIFDIDLSLNNLGEINNSFYSSHFVDNFETYKNSIIDNLFIINNYSYKFNIISNDDYNGVASVRIVFTNNEDVTQSYTYTVNFKNFALKPYIDLNQQEVQKNQNVSYDVVDQSTLNITIDVSETKFYDINSKMDANEIVNDFGLYQSDILKLFDYSPEDYDTTINPVYDENNNMVNVDIVFTLKQTNEVSFKASTKPEKITVRVSIVGFDKAAIITGTMIAIVVLVAIIALIISITMIIMIKKGRKLNLKTNNLSKKITSKK